MIDLKYHRSLSLSHLSLPMIPCIKSNQNQTRLFRWAITSILVKNFMRKLLAISIVPFSSMHVVQHGYVKVSLLLDFVKSVDICLQSADN